MRPARIALLGSLAACGVAEPPICTAAPDSSARPLVHFTPPAHWMNDPAGPVYYQGQYHLFYQRDPHPFFVSDMRWGHAVSPDLLAWTDLPDALSPDPVLGVPYTGSAVVDDGTSGLCDGGCLVAVFTHAFGEDGAQKQSVATSTDGQTFALYADNPVLRSPGPADFRDPKVRRYGEGWRMVVGTMDGVLIYGSTDLRTWSAVGAFSDPALHGAWECPDLFPLTAPDGTERWVLKVDVNPGALQAGPSRAWVGAFDGDTFTPDGPPAAFDGPDLYAAQTFSDTPDGAVVWMGWMSAWSYAMFTPTEGYRGAMSLPRALSLAEGPDGLQLVQTPIVPEGCALLDGPAAADGALLDDPGPAYVITAHLSGPASFTVLEGEAEQTVVGWQDGALFVDRTASGDTAFHDAFPGRYEAPAPGDALDLVVVVDRTSVEVFGGGAALTAAVYPQEAAHGLSVTGAVHVSDLSVRSLPRQIPRE